MFIYGRYHKNSLFLTVTSHFFKFVHDLLRRRFRNKTDGYNAGKADKEAQQEGINTGSLIQGR